VTKMVSAREFNQQTSRTLKDAAVGPVIITHRGRPSQVLMSYEEYQRLTGGKAPKSLTDMAATWPTTPDCPEFDEILEEIRSRKELPKPIEFD
jgi:prevent-host-death family protein